MEKRAKKTGVASQALLDRPTIKPRVLPYYRAWALLDPRRQFNESGAQAIPLSEVIEVAKILIGDDPEDVYDFCKVMSSVESFVLSELAEERKRAIARAKANSK